VINGQKRHKVVYIDFLYRLSMNWIPMGQTISAALGTAQTMFPEIKDIRLIDTYISSPLGFDNLRVENHRAVLGQSLDDTFPISDRPRGIDDINSVNYFLNGGGAEPITVLIYKHRLTKLDGVHRLVASYILNSPIKWSLYEPIITN
jgi:hypothetical protein